MTRKRPAKAKPEKRATAAGAISRGARPEEEAFRLMVDNVADYAIFLLTPDGKIATWNLGAERMKGYKAPEIIGRHFSVLYTPDDLAAGKPQRELESAAENGRFEDESWRVRKDGSKFWANVVLTALRDERGGLRGFAKVTRDMTARKLEEDRFRIVVEAAPNAMVLVDRAGKIAFVNSQAERLFGCSREDLLGRSIETLVPPRFRAKHPGYVRGFLAQPSARPMGAGRDLYGLRKDGAEVPVEIGLNPIETPDGTFVLASIIDITERKKSEERFRMVVEGSPNAIVIVGQDGKINFVNLQAERLFLYPREELIGKAIETLVPERFRGKHPGYRDGFFAEPRVRPMGAGRDLYGLRKDGSEVPVEIGLNPLKTPAGVLVLASIIDISERKKAEAELRRGREDLAQRAADLEDTVAKRTEHLQRVIAELEAFSYTASHDLRAPLRAIEGYSHFLSEMLGPGVDAEARSLLGRISASAARMDRLVQDLLAYSRIGRGEEPMGPVDLDAVVSHIVDTYPGLHKIRLRVKSPLGRVMGKDSLVTQTLSNLINNAIKFVPETRPPSIEIRTRREGSRRTLFVEDNGIGIAREHHEKIFNPFVRLDASGKYEGTGIGLAIVKKAVDRMGGRVSLESRVGEGTTFAVELEAAP